MAYIYSTNKLIPLPFHQIFQYTYMGDLQAFQIQNYQFKYA